MIKKIKFVIIILFFSFIFFVFFKGLEKPNSYLPEKNLTEIDTSLLFKNLYDQKEILLGELISKNSFSIVNIWASWCLPCRDEHIYLTQLKKNSPLKIIGINYKDKKSNAEKFLDEFGNPYEYILNDKNGTASIEIGAYGVPESFILNKQKEILKKIIGPIDQKKFKKVLKIIKNEN